MESFTPVSGLVGGVLIGLAATGLLAASGRIAGVSGILFGVLRPAGGGVAWRIAFLAGLVQGGLVYAVLGLGPTDFAIQADLPVLIGAGLLVGLGTRIGSGCTSGHGVCGLGLASGRSLAATATFFATALVVVFVVRHGIGG